MIEMNNKKMPKISIITVCFNESAENIKFTFDNISFQTYGNIEWIVIDGGSKPETISEIKKYEKAIDKFVSEPDKGIYDAMNKGLSYATGDFVVFMNVGDSFYSTETLEQAANFIINHPQYDCFYGDVVAIDSEGKEWASPQTRKINRFILQYSMICHQSIISRRSLYDNVGNFDINYKIIADRDWILRSIDKGAKWVFMNIFICSYDMNGVSSDVSKRRIEADRFIKKNYGAFENFMSYFSRKICILKRRLMIILRCRYKGLHIIISK